MKKLIMALLASACMFNCSDAFAKAKQNNGKRQKQKMEKKREKKKEEDVKKYKEKLAECEEKLAKLSDDPNAPYAVKEERKKLLDSKRKTENKLQKLGVDLKVTDKEDEEKKKDKKKDKKKKKNKKKKSE